MLILSRDKSSGRVVYTYPRLNADTNEVEDAPSVSQCKLSFSALNLPKNTHDITRSFSLLVENIKRKTIATDLIVDCNGLNVNFVVYLRDNS